MVEERGYNVKELKTVREIRLKKIMADEVVKFFQTQFHEDKVPTYFRIIDHVPCMVDMEQNQDLLKQPTKEEVKVAVFGFNGESAGGLDGFTGCFFHTCGT